MNSSSRFVNPETHHSLIQEEDKLIDSITRAKVAVLQDGIPRFVSPADNYAESFGWQWKYWSDNLSESRGANIKHRQLILDRTHFLDYELNGKAILECGMGGGDDILQPAIICDNRWSC